jgi:RES domain-containing protein
VPSAIVPNELNFILNPEHADFERVKIGQASPFQFDPRLK